MCQINVPELTSQMLQRLLFQREIDIHNGTEDLFSHSQQKDCNCLNRIMIQIFQCALQSMIMVSVCKTHQKTNHAFNTKLKKEKDIIYA